MAAGKLRSIATAILSAPRDWPNPSFKLAKSQLGVWLVEVRCIMDLVHTDTLYTKFYRYIYHNRLKGHTLRLSSSPRILGIPDLPD